MEALAGEDIKDGAPFWAIYSGLLWVVPTNTGIFLRGLKLSGVTMHFSEMTKFQFGKKRHTLLCIFLFFRIVVA